MRLWTITTSIVALAVTAPPVAAQITSVEHGDGILNAPYRGTVDSLRIATESAVYGEVRNHTEPRAELTLEFGTPLRIWFDGTDWDRSLLRLYRDYDASGVEIDLNGNNSRPTAFEINYGGAQFVKFSLKAIATKTTAVQRVTIHYEYEANGTRSVTENIDIAPTTSFHDLPGLSEAFHLGTVLLDVSVGTARLTVPVGRTAEMMGNVYSFLNEWGPSPRLRTYDTIYPGTAESVYLSTRLSHDPLGTFKSDWGTPWAGFLIGYWNDTDDPMGPDGTRYDFQDIGAGGYRKVKYARPPGANFQRPPTLEYRYMGGAPFEFVKDVSDHSNLMMFEQRNSIVLDRPVGPVTRIDTSDGRSWTIASDPTDGWVTGISPASGTGARSFVYNTAGRVTQVLDASTPEPKIIYQFEYSMDSQGELTRLSEEKRVVDGTLQKVVEHVELTSTEFHRKEFTGNPSNPGEFRRFDFFYDTDPKFANRLASTKSYENVNAGGTVYETILTHDKQNPRGNMTVTRIDLPDGSWIDHEYDSHVRAEVLDFGFLTKSTHHGTMDGDLITFDVDYEFLWDDGKLGLFQNPRIVQVRDGRHDPASGFDTQVVFDFEDGSEFGGQGQFTNRLLSATGPLIRAGTTPDRTPFTQYEYVTFPNNEGTVLESIKTFYDAVNFRTVEFGYDELLRVTSETLEPAGENIVTQFQYVDDQPTQDRIVIDPDNYYSKSTFDQDGRLLTMQRFLVAGGATGNFYQTESVYDVNGWLSEEKIDNKDQDGNVIPGETNPIVVMHVRDETGRLLQRVVDPTGIAREENFDYNWMDEIERQYDTTGRGVQITYKGRGLADQETPLNESQTPDNNRITSLTYDANGRPATRSHPATGTLRHVYDDFGRLKTLTHEPGSRGGNDLIAAYTYDEASNVSRTVVSEDDGMTVTILTDSTENYDEGGFNYESRKRTVYTALGTDSPDDPVVRREYDWDGAINKESALADNPSGDHVTTMEYDDAGRPFAVRDSEGGETIFMLDDRGNVLEQRVKLDAIRTAVTTSVFDALGRATRITDPQDSQGFRAYRDRRYDSRGSLRLQTVFEHDNTPRQTIEVSLDAAGRTVWRAARADATAGGSPLNRGVDRVTDFQYLDPDGRLQYRSTYNNGTTTPLQTELTYHPQGFVQRVTDPSGSHVEHFYTLDGLHDSREDFDGQFTRTTDFGRDGHGRIIAQTAMGDPADPFDDLVTLFTVDGLGRATSVTSPKTITSSTQYDLVGRPQRTIQNDGGTLERETVFAYDKLSQLILRTAKNRASDNTPLADQSTHYRYDTAGRLSRVVYPDSLADPNDPNCVDCIRRTFDVGGRMIQRHDQRNDTTLDYDDRGLLWKGTTGTTLDTFTYDALGRVATAQRGTIADPDAVALSVRSYTDLGGLDLELQTIGGGTAQSVDYDHDQAGNRTILTYPGSTQLTYVPTELNRVDTIQLGGQAFVNYDYEGRTLKKRVTTTTNFPSTSYATQWQFDWHRRNDRIFNSVASFLSVTVIANFSFEFDDHGNPISQDVVGLPVFGDDERDFTVDELDRLTTTSYPRITAIEDTTFDLIGNREVHTNRAAVTTTYGVVNEANEYSTIGGIAVTYDATGNLATDEDGRTYTYDERNRLIEIRAADMTLLVRYTYDAFGRRIMAEFDPDDPGNDVTIRYYWDGHTVIEERDENDLLVRSHANGGQFMDERVASFTPANAFTYYLHGRNFAVIGSGSADGTKIERHDFSALGDFAGSNGPQRIGHDADLDGDVDLADFANLQRCFATSDPACLGVHDFDVVCVSDGAIDGNDFAGFDVAYDGPSVVPASGCSIGSPGDPPPPTGTFTLHGRPVDVLSDGHVFYYIRARYYDPKHARWLQRDPRSYVDGSNLYESFGADPVRSTDPLGKQDFDPTVVGFFGTSAAEVRRHLRAASYPIGGSPPITRSEFQRLVKRNHNPPSARLLPTGHEVKIETQRILLSIFRDTSPFPSESYGQHLRDEIKATRDGVLLLYGVFIPGYDRLVLDLVAPHLAEELTPEKKFELGILAPLQGGTFALEGTVNVAVGTGNLLLFPVNEIGSNYSHTFHLEIPRVPSSNGFFVQIPERTANVSRIVGGESILFLTGVGVFRPRPNIIIGELDQFGRATGVRLRITPDMIGTGRRARVAPVGLTDDMVRAHLWGKQLGGSGKIENVVAFFKKANSPVMRRWENQVRRAAERGEIIDYLVVPVYRGANPIPLGVTIQARGDRGLNIAVSVLNRP